MIEKSFTVEQCLAVYWLDTKTTPSTANIQTAIRKSAEDRGFEVEPETIQEVVGHINGAQAGGDVNQWVVFICFRGHPHTLWNFMLDTVALAENDQHLEKIAAELAEHILSHYGSMIDYFEKWSEEDQVFKRMLTGIWRHRMSDEVWMRLRAIQADVSDPLPNMIPIEHGKDYMWESLSNDDRTTSDKGFYVRNKDGEWDRKS